MMNEESILNNRSNCLCFDINKLEINGDNIIPYKRKNGR